MSIEIRSTSAVDPQDDSDPTEMTVAELTEVYFLPAAMVLEGQRERLPDGSIAGGYIP